VSEISDRLNWLPKPLRLTRDEAAASFLAEAYTYAEASSPDPSTKNGAVLVGRNNEIITYGVNKFPPGVAETQERLMSKEIKYRLIVHAESGAILNAAKNGRIVRGATLYCPFYACSECAKAIIHSEIETVVGHAQLMAMAAEHATWTKSIVAGWGAMLEAGVRCILYDGEIGAISRFNGQDVLV